LVTTNEDKPELSATML